jgi:branched-chain amino acid transport system permease protein
MQILVQQVASGLVSGCIYGCLGLGLVMIYRATNHVNFAQGEMAMLSTFIAWALLQAGVPYEVAFITTLAFSFLAGVLIQRLVLRPVHHSPVIVTVVAFIALMAILQSLAGWIFDYSSKSFPSPFESLAFLGRGVVGGHEIGIFLVTGCVLVLMYLFFTFTSTGLAMRAAASNPISSKLVGIPVEKLIALGWGISGMVGAIAGMLAAPVVFLEPHMMSGIMIYSFAAAILGGIDSPKGAVVGGFIVGVSENLAGAYLTGTELKLTVALAIIFIVLIVKPTGLFGSQKVVRV